MVGFRSTHLKIYPEISSGQKDVTRIVCAIFGHYRHEQVKTGLEIYPYKIWTMSG